MTTRPTPRRPRTRPTGRASEAVRPAAPPVPDVSSSKDNAAERIQRALVRRILRGELPPGANLPSVRALATEFEVTAPTIQRVLVGLEALRLVEARHGSGVRVLDPARDGGLALLPHWVEALADEPARLVPIVTDALELRRWVAMHLATKVPSGAGAAALAPALARVLEAQTVAARRAADLAFTRAFLDASGHFAVRALVNSIADTLHEVPAVAEAVYGDEAVVRTALLDVVRAFAEGGPEAPSRVEAALARWDEAALARLLGRAPGRAQGPATGRTPRASTS